MYGAVVSADSSTSSPKVFLIGYYGFANAGDEYLLKKTICLMKEVYHTPRICVLYRRVNRLKDASKSFLSVTKNPPYCNSKVLGEVTFCARANIFKLLQTLFRADVVAFGGGGVFQTASSWRSIYYYLFLLAIAILARKPTYLVAQGIGPITGRLPMCILRKLAARASAVTLRDQFSADILPGIGILAADLAYYKANPLPFPPEAMPVVGISLREHALWNNIRAPLLEAIQNIKQKMVFLDFDVKRDFEAALKLNNDPKIFQERLDMNDYFVNQTIPPFQFSIIVAMRYHACVWASLHNIPFVALAYDPKVKNLALELGQPYLEINSPNDVFAQTIIQEKVALVLANLPSYKTNLTTGVDRLIKRAALNRAMFS